MALLTEPTFQLLCSFFSVCPFLLQRTAEQYKLNADLVEAQPMTLCTACRGGLERLTKALVREIAMHYRVGNVLQDPEVIT